MKAKIRSEIPADWLNDRISDWWDDLNQDEFYIEDLFWETHSEDAIVQEYNEEEAEFEEDVEENNDETMKELTGKTDKEYDKETLEAEAEDSKLNQAEEERHEEMKP